MLNMCKKNKFKISDLMMENECTLNNKTQVKKKIMDIWDTMNNCINSGINAKGKLDGQLKVKEEHQKFLKH